jgi:integrase
MAYYDRRQGKQVREYGFATEAAAEKALRARLVDLARGRRVGPSIEKVTFEQLAQLITDDYRINRRDTAARVKQSIAHLKLTFGDARALDITGDRVTGYASTRLEEGAAPATVNRELAALKRMFRLAIQAKRLTLDQVPYVAMLREDNVRKGFIEPDQLDAILGHLAPRAQRAVTVAYITGWRVPSEVLTREWRHVDLDAGWLRLEPGETKNGRGRMFPVDFDPRLRAVLQDAKDEADAIKKKAGAIVPWVFRRKGGERVAGFRKEWEAACTAAGVPGRLLHDLRRSAARNMLRAGHSTRTVMELAGWETESMLRRYAIVDETVLSEAAEKNRAFLGLRLGSNSVRESSETASGEKSEAR